MNGTQLHVTRQDVACFVLCVLIKIPCLITTFRRQILFTRRSSRLVLIMLSNGRKGKCKTAKIKGDRHIKGAKVPGNESSRERKFHRMIELSFPGAKRPGYERARERIGQGTRRPGSEKARERKFQGVKVPGSELARVLLADSLRGANWPGSEKARYH